MTYNIREERLNLQSSGCRLNKLHDIRMSTCSDMFKIKEYLCFIAEELVFLNQERRKK